LIQYVSKRLGRFLPDCEMRVLQLGAEGFNGAVIADVPKNPTSRGASERAVFAKP
jgi:hypothetical protein